MQGIWTMCWPVDRSAQLDLSLSGEEVAAAAGALAARLGAAGWDARAAEGATGACRARALRFATRRVGPPTPCLGRRRRASG